MKIRQLAITSFLFSFCLAGISQGMTVFTGTSSMRTNLTSLTANETAHTGFQVGADGRLGDDSFYFMVGLSYHKLDFNSTPDYSFKVTDPNIGFIKGKGGLAFKLFKINEDIVTRLRLMGAIDYILQHPKMDAEDNPSNLDFNEAVAGAIGGLEVDIYFLTLQLEYEKGFFNSVRETEGSSMNFLTASLGVNF